ATRFTDESESLTPKNIERDSVHSFDHAVAVEIEVHLQISNADEGCAERFRRVVLGLTRHRPHGRNDKANDDRGLIRQTAETRAGKSVPRGRSDPQTDNRPSNGPRPEANRESGRACLVRPSGPERSAAGLLCT